VTSPLPRPIAFLLVVVVVLRVGSVTWSATERTRGDFYASMPGAYVEAINPTLWNSPDLQGAWGYHLDTYFHGPIQYLTLYWVAWFDSFAEIAAVLLPIYLVLLGVIFWLQWGIARRLGAPRHFLVPLLAATFLFFPLLQAYLQREFEVVLTVAYSGALLLLLQDRRLPAAALLAYGAWFKYIPLLFAGYLFLRQWWREMAVFAAVSAVIVALTELLFGWYHFFNNNVPGHAAQVFEIFSYGFARDPKNAHLYGSGFCNGWFDIESTFTNIRHGLCAMAAYNPWVHPVLIYNVSCLAVAGLYLWTHARLQRMTLTADQEARRRAIEFAIVTTVCTLFFFAHYYYLIALVIPFNVLFVIYLRDARWRALALWAVSYVLVSAFFIPMSVLSRLAGYDMWEPYVWQGWFLYGEFLLVGLLLDEYRRLARPSSA
jgi:hypothetical protein